MEVPAPPWIGSTIKLSCNFPSIISSAAAIKAFAILLSRRAVFKFAIAAAFFTIASAMIKSESSFCPVILKL